MINSNCREEFCKNNFNVTDFICGTNNGAAIILNLEGL